MRHTKEQQNDTLSTRAVLHRPTSRRDGVCTICRPHACFATTSYPGQRSLRCLRDTGVLALGNVVRVVWRGLLAKSWMCAQGAGKKDGVVSCTISLCISFGQTRLECNKATNAACVSGNGASSAQPACSDLQGSTFRLQKTGTVGHPSGVPCPQY